VGFLPALRSRTKALGASKVPAVVPSPFPLRSQEAKVVLSSYYEALVNATMHSRARQWSVEQSISLGYERIVWAFKAVNAIAGNASRLPIVVKDGENIVEDHPLTKLLNGRAANPLETGPGFRKRLSAQYCLSKPGVFVEVTKTYGGTIKRLDLLPPGRTEIVPPRYGDDLVDHYVVTTLHGERRPIDVDKVIWFREHHPLDPYSGVTPLEPANLSIELDHFARLYNVNFLARDGRPGGIVGVETVPGEDGEMSESEMDRIESKFGKGPTEAGALTVLAGKLTYVDVASKPRDMAYQQLSQNAKAEILGAFGVPLSVIGDASGRTFSNAEQELDNFWLVHPMPDHISGVLAGFQELLGDEDLEVSVDDSKVESMRRAKAKQLEEARAEIESGVRSIGSYLELAGRSDEAEDIPQMRAFWVPAGRNPLPSREEDAAALGQGGPGGAAGPPADGAPAGPDGAGDPAAADGAPPELPPGAPPAPGVGTATRAVAMLPATTSASAAVARLQGAAAASKALPAGRRARSPRQRTVLKVNPVDEEPHRERNQPVTADHEAAVAAALEALTERFIERTVARVQEPKRRKGTRHFAAQHEMDTRVGTKALDTSKAVDPERWGQETEDAARPALTAAAAAAAAQTASDLTGDDETHPGARAAVIAAVVALAGRSARRQGERLAAVLNLADQAGEALAVIVEKIRAWAARLKRWARSLAAHLITAIVEGSSQAEVVALAQAGIIDPEQVEQTWVTRRDERVRETHEDADGQTVSLGAPFIVGRALLRYPGDPAGPPEEIANCRCWVRLRVRAPRRLLIKAAGGV
jgi:HK97 family phage portal protein